MLPAILGIASLGITGATGFLGIGAQKDAAKEQAKAMAAQAKAASERTQTIQVIAVVGGGALILGLVAFRVLRK